MKGKEVKQVMTACGKDPALSRTVENADRT
jgi:hypothetical protein